MTERGVTESVVEDAALAWLEAGGWQVAHSPDIAPRMLGREPPVAGRSGRGSEGPASRLSISRRPGFQSAEP